MKSNNIHLFMKKLILLLLILNFSAKVNAEAGKITLAIMEFRANNTKTEFADACMDMLSENLFSSKTFTLMEKSQMDRIARMHGFKEFNTVDPDQVAKLGKILKVDKLLTGSITYLDAYIIDVKTINASTGEIEFNVKRKIDTIKDLDGTLANIAETIERHYLGYYRLSGKADFTAEMRFLYPAGVLKDVVSGGVGMQLYYSYNNIIGPVDMLALAGYYNFRPQYQTIEYFNMFPAFICAAYKISPARNLKIIPSTGFGYVFTVINYDGEHGSGMYSDGKNFYYNPAVLIRTEFNLLIYDTWYLVFSPQYNAFFTGDQTGHFISFGVGLKMLF